MKFKPGDVVKYPAKERWGGVVRFIVCGKCIACTAKLFNECNGTPDLKTKVYVQWPKDPLTNKILVGTYAPEDLEYESNSVQSSSSDIDWDKYHGYGVYRRKYKVENDTIQKPLESHEVDWDVYNGFKKGRVSKRV